MGLHPTSIIQPGSSGKLCLAMSTWDTLLHRLTSDNRSIWLFILPSFILILLFGLPLVALILRAGNSAFLEYALSDQALSALRLWWGGRLRLGMTLATGCAVACLRLGKAEVGASAEPLCERLELATVLPAPLAVEESISGQRLPPVESARIVVSGGRGVNEQGFALLEELAERLDGSLGGSLPAVDAGMVPVVRQVGVSGKFVSPDIYLAVGISGTPQHLAGISPDTRIVAINKDPAADIFKVASVGVVGDWEQVLPELLRVVGEGVS